MKKIRIGNDIVIKWRITVNGEEFNLEGLDLSLYISTTYQPRKAIAFTVAGNEITATFKGTDQNVTGVYRLTLYRNEGENSQSILDACDAFELVSCSCLTVDAAFGGAEVELPIADLGVGIPGLSAYEIAVYEGFVGTQAEWLASLSAASEAAAAECREVIAEFSQAEDSRVTAEAQRVANENNRIAGEGSRVEAENDRAAAEQLRATAESKRDTAELARIANESNRVSAEGARSSAEELRKSNEQSRISEETTRSNNETARAAAEESRVAAEQSRQSAEADRLTNERSRVATESQRVSNETARKDAEDARVANEAARQSAEATRQSNEQSRQTAEAARAEAEQVRAEEFAGFSTAIAAKEDAANKVTSINADADDVHYPTAKAVFGALESEILNLIGSDSIRSGFYDKDANYKQSEGFCCAKIDISNALSVRVKAYVYGGAVITLTDDSNSILYQITDNYSTKPFIVNVGEYNSAKWLYVSNNTSNIPIDDVIIEAVQLKESVSASILKVNSEVQSNKKNISALSELSLGMTDKLNLLESDVESIVGGSKRIDTTNGLIYQRKSYLDASGNIAAAGSENWYISEYYPIDNVTRIELYAIANWEFSVCAICDENKNVISTLKGIGEKKLYEITEFPEGAKYIRFHSHASDSYVIFEKKSKIEGKSLKDKNVLIISDSISTGASSQKRNPNWISYGSYDKWVDRLIATGFFSDEKTYNCSWHATGFVADQNGTYDSFVKRLKAIAEPSKYDYVIVFGGINDWIKSVSMEDFRAKVDEFFLYLINNFTTARIVVITPLQCYSYEVASRYNENNAGLYQKDYADYLEEVCEKYALPVLDFRRHSGFCPTNEVFRNRWTLVTANPDGGYWPADGTHPIKEFEDNFMAPNIQNFIEKFL